VNIKIWLDTEVNAGELPEADRNRILNEMTGAVEDLVLRDNKQQTHLLTREAQAQATASVVDGYAALITNLESEGAVNRELEQLPTDTELARRKALGLGLTAPELAVVIANVKNRFKRTLLALPLVEESWAESLLRPYFPAQMVATRNPLNHPLANAILATVLANEAVNRCGPLMLRDLAAEHRVDETEVVKAWARAWSALHLSPVFDALDADALKVPRDVSMAVDTRTRALMRAVIEGVLSLPAGADGMAELSTLFGQADQLRSLTPARSEADGHSGLPASFTAAWKAVETIESLATFLFAAVSVQRPGGMSLAQFLQVGMALRQQAGIDMLERGLKLPAQSKAQEQLRNYAMQALRRTQQRLLLQVIERAGQGGDPLAAVKQVTEARGLTGFAQPVELEQAMLDVWALSEGSSPDRLAA
jgi:glutamate dehydrogenase